MMSVYQTSKSEPNSPEKGKSSDSTSEAKEQEPEQQLIHLRQQIVAIAHRMGQAETVEKLLQVSVDQLQEKLNCDRALVYHFETENQGHVLAEAKNRGWTPTEGETLPVTTFGFDSRQEYLDQTLVILEKKQPQLTPYQQQLLERFQIQASATVPIIIANKLWGLLSVQQCENSRQWSESEKLLLEQISIQLTLSLQQSEYQKQLQGIEAREQALAGVIEKIRRSLDQETIFKNLTQEVRNFMNADRVGVYRFDENWSGEFIAESVGGNWIKLVGPGIRTVWEDTHLQDTQGGRYRYHEVFAVDDVYKAGHSPCHVDILEQFEVKAYLIVPIFVGEKLWGLLGVYQNANPRHWTKQEVQDMERVASQLWEVLQQADNLQQIKSSSEQLAQSAERERTIVKIVDRIRRSLDLNSLFNTTAREIRGQLKADRVGVFRFYPESGFDDGEFVSEDVNSNYSSAVKEKVHDHCFGTDYADKYEQGKIQAVSDIYNEGLSDCHIDILSQFQVRANLIVPILKESKLWGLLCVHQCAEPREWKENEIDFVKQIAAQFGVALQQAEYLEQIQAKSKQLAESADRDRAVTKVVNRIRQTLDLETIFRITTQEVRSLLRCDRVAVFRFNPDWSGVFVSESVAPGWVSLVEKQYGIDRLQESIRDCDNVKALVQGKEKTLRAEMPNRQMLLDDVMKETQGGQTTREGMFIRDDIYAANFDPCYVEVLEEYQTKAYAIVSIYRGDKLWGMLAAYQNSGPRHWQDVEINLLTQIASQLGVALQQAEYIQQIQAKSKQLAESAERERTLNKVIDRIRKSFDLETIFRTTTQEVRQLIQTDRVAIYKFRPDYFGDFIAESEAPGEPKLAGLDRLTAWEDPYLNEEKGGRFQENKPLVVDDVYNGGLTDCHVEALEMFHVKACVVVAIFKGDKLWGLLSAFDNKKPRHWENYEVELLRQVANQIGIAIQQTEYLKELQTQSIQLEASAQREKQAKEEIEMRAVQLLRAVRPALDGDLTVRAPVTDDVVGTIADAYNNTLQSLRKLVGQVQKAAQQVALTSNNSDAAIGGLTTSAQAQSQDIAQALDKIEQMVASTNAVVENARLVEVAVQRANQTVETGDRAMNRTVDSIQVIRETVAQTAKKIKSLSDSSQKISKAVNLIGNFATQTNVLALNAAIEATRAGEYGKGFAVVAEEVRSLSRQSAEATKEIEELVKEIQEGTGEVAATMEKGIQQVVEGTNLVNETRESLNEIVSSTTEISQLVESITQATQVQTQQSQLVTKVMTEVAEVANQTSGESTQMSASFKELLDMAQELLTTTGKFKVD